MLFLAAFFFFTALQLVYWLGIFRKLSTYQRPVLDPSFQPSVSVVICARDEAENLRQNLPRFLNQNYRSFEVVVVNDHSQDETAQILLEFRKSFSNLRVIRPQLPTRPGKKEALEVGIRAAQYKHILVSDADCYPCSTSWIKIMTQYLSEKELVLGYSPYLRGEGFLNRFQRYETVYTAIQFFSFALVRMPYMGVGRNMAYLKGFFFRGTGLSLHADLISGDDDLLVNANARAQKTAIVLERAAFVQTSPTSSWRGYYNQKFRHTSAGSRYRPEHQLVLGMQSLSHFSHYAFAVATLMLQSGLWPLILLTYLVRISVVVWVWYGVTRRLGDRDLLVWVPLLDFLFLSYYLLFAPALLTGRSLEQWK